MTSHEHRLSDYLVFLYGPVKGQEAWEMLHERLKRYSNEHPELKDSGRQRPLSAADSMLITYGDQVRQAGIPHLQSLTEFLRTMIGGWLPNVHLLPFYPYSSDDGFSVIDYRQVNPQLGAWDDIRSLSQDFHLMFDAVINHISRSSEWFKQYSQGIPPYTDYFLEVDPSLDLSQVFRPRTHPLLTPVQVGGEARYVWTTFSADQIDLNFANPQVLLEILDLLLFYVTQGARFIRLDAIAFLWKEIGTRCLHLPQTHAVIQLMRTMLDWVAPGTRLITETNVPHQENISYFGDGSNEAHLVFNFALPPLVLHSFRVGEARKLSAWAAGLSLPTKQVTYFNFLASHDGIGVTPARGILTEAEIAGLVEQARHHGGLVSARTLPDGSQVPYELNINYFDALSNPDADEPLETQIDRFVTAHAIMLALVGMPGIYFHSLFGSRGWREGVSATGQNRTINRQKLQRQELERDISDPHSRQAIVFTQLRALLQARASHPAFSPYAEQRIFNLSPAVFAVLRGETGGCQALCIHNVSGEPLSVCVDLVSLDGRGLRNLLTGSEQAGEELLLDLPPYGRLWFEVVKT